MLLMCHLDDNYVEINVKRVRFKQNVMVKDAIVTIKDCGQI